MSFRTFVRNSEWVKTNPNSAIQNPKSLCFPVEAMVWMAALVALACTDPHAEGLLDLCVFKWLGLPGCPGCGLGHSIAFLFNGEWLLSWQAHPLGGFAVAVLSHRILVSFRVSIFDFRMRYGTVEGRKSKGARQHGRAASQPSHVFAALISRFARVALRTLRWSLSIDNRHS